jgi:hypothetical protein
MNSMNAIVFRHSTSHPVARAIRRIVIDNNHSPARHLHEHRIDELGKILDFIVSGQRNQHATSDIISSLTIKIGHNSCSKPLSRIHSVEVADLRVLW